jgi:hypothetical protein
MMWIAIKVQTAQIQLVHVSMRIRCTAAHSQDRHKVTTGNAQLTGKER